MSFPKRPEPGNRNEPVAERLTRRRLLTLASLAAAGGAGLRSAVGAAEPAGAAQGVIDPTAGEGVLRLGLIADLHPDFAPDAIHRLQAFLSASRGAGVDAVVQLGDFAMVREQNAALLELWRSLDAPPRHGVLGNHDMDGGVDRDRAAEAFGMPARHYVAELKGAKLIFLDGNEPTEGIEGYPRAIGAAQLEWLRGELAKDDKPVVAFVHQPPLDMGGCLVDGEELMQVLEQANSPRRRVQALFCGHLHRDFLIESRGIPCIQVNSASYCWSGDFYHYQGPLWAIADLDLGSGSIAIRGTETRWTGKTPADDGREADPRAPQVTEVSSRFWQPA